MNMGTNTGARIAHLAEAEPMNRFMKAEKRTKMTISGMRPMSTLPRKSAPARAMMVPSLV